MFQREGEKHLAVAYGVCIALGITASVTTGIAWGHWKGTLDLCVDRNCSCILYAKETPIYFLGGDLAPCAWVTFGPLVYALFCLGFACFHGYRVLFESRGTTTRTITTKNEVGETVVMQATQTDDTSPLQRCFWICASVFSSIFTVYALVHFSVFFDGYLTTCNEYRKELVRQFPNFGTAANVIYNRLACNAIFDFMDYMQPATGLSHRNGFINTAADLIIGLICSMFSWLLLAYAAFINIRFARFRT